MFNSKWNTFGIHVYIFEHCYDILGAGMLWKPKEARKFVKIRAKECFDKVLYHVNSRILKCKMKNVITMSLSLKL
jgi:hypothetical protein